MASSRAAFLATAFLAMPLTFVLSNDAFYFGVVPVIAETAAHYQLDPAVIGRASLLAGEKVAGNCSGIARPGPPGVLKEGIPFND